MDLEIELQDDNIETEASGVEKINVNNYNALENKPKINDVELIGNKTLEELGIQPEGDYANSEELEEIKKENVELKEDVKALAIPCKAEGESITLNDSSSARVESVEVSGNSEQEVTEQGINYFTGNKIGNGTGYGVTYNFNNSILILNGTSTSSGNIMLDIPTKVKIPKGTYTYTIKVNSGTYEIPAGDFALYLMSGSNTSITGSYATSGITGGNLKAGIKSLTFTIQEDIELYLRIFVSNANIVFNNLELYIQVENGSSYTEFKQFVPNSPSPDYPSKVKSCGDNGSINTVVCNKNLFIPAIYNGDIAITCSSGTVSLENDTFIFKCTDSDMYFGEVANKGNSYYKRYGKLINVKGLSSISVTLTNELFVKNYITFWNDNLIVLGNKTINSSIFNNVALPNGTAYVTFRFGMYNSESGVTYKTQVQIEEGVTATDYIEHQEQSFTILTQQPFRKIGDYADTFVKKLGKWYERHYITRKIFDGTETIEIADGRYQITSAVLKTIGSVNWNKILLISNYFKGSSFNSLKNENNNISYHPYNKYPVIYSTDFSTVDDLKNILSDQYNAGTPVYIDYVLETPIDIECTEEQSTILDKLNNSRTYKNVTHIYSTDEISPNMKVTYCKDMETVVNNINTAVVALGGVE